MKEKENVIEILRKSSESIIPTYTYFTLRESTSHTKSFASLFAPLVFVESSSTEKALTSNNFGPSPEKRRRRRRFRKLLVFQFCKSSPSVYLFFRRRKGKVCKSDLTLMFCNRQKGRKLSLPQNLKINNVCEACPLEATFRKHTIVYVGD